jgi:predicted ATPase
MLAEAYIRSNLFEEAVAAVDEGLAVAARNGDQYWTPELHRLRAGSLLALGNLDAAETSFQTAVRLAQAQQSRLLSLRATVALSRLWASRNMLTEARAALSTEFGWFTEGFDSIDLIEARAALTELSEQVS